MSATASPSVSILSSYNASVAKGSGVVGFGGSMLEDGCAFTIRIDLPEPPGLGNAYKSVKSRRASPWGKPKLGPEKWCDMVIPSPLIDTFRPIELRCCWLAAG